MQFKKPQGDIFWASLVWAGLGVLGLVVVATSAEPVDGPSNRWMVAALTVSLSVALLVWLDAKWIAWPTMICYGLSALAVVVKLFIDGVSLRGVGRLALPLWFIWCLYEWRYSNREAPDEEPPDESPPILSFVALLREPVFVDAAILATAAKKAWGVDLAQSDVGLDDDGDDDDRGQEPDDGPGDFVVGSGPFNMIRYDGRIMLVNALDRPYVEDVDSVAAGFGDLRLQTLFREHRAWLSCDATTGEPLDDDAEVRAWYRLLGRLLCELVDDNCLAIYLPLTQQMFANMPQTLEMLRADDPVAELTAAAYVPLVRVKDDDPRVAAAVEEARKKFPQFAHAFAQGAGESFSIKAPITSGGNTEFIWVGVDAIENGVIYGKLGNEPIDLAGLGLGSPVRVPVAGVNDWVYIAADGKPVGLFSAGLIG